MADKTPPSAGASPNVQQNASSKAAVPPQKRNPAFRMMGKLDKLSHIDYILTVERSTKLPLQAPFSKLAYLPLYHRIIHDCAHV